MIFFDPATGLLILGGFQLMEINVATAVFQAVLIFLSPLSWI